ncbi:hypothetical protein NUU61_009670 [Penicillium alfredii]|uniref:serine--tRNA ligase n=1 Tax=Penicillium alfredii TaxID=1506179 RepID=A0A9W9JTV8_9EURO|nr:uncharacterized protein NUU61_009670 [Penicillium alfredii]KAJ5081406.1 hypothetical protein NUU61_009670 [Penicillium alfredii]
MLDLADFVKDRGGDPNKIKESQRRRFAPEETVDGVIALYEEARGADLEQRKKAAEEVAIQKEKQRDRQVALIGNYVHESVPVSNNEVCEPSMLLEDDRIGWLTTHFRSQDDNQVIKTWAPKDAVMERENCLSHHEVLTRLDGYDPERGVKIVGHRGYCLTGYGLFLNLALINYGLEFLFGKGYKPNQPPQFMLRDLMAKTAQLEQFDEELYKVTESEDKSTDKYLIATSEQPLSALHDSEWLQEKDLPIKYAGYSTCYRKEAGAHGKDAWGIFRVHQFEKIEQFVLTKPDDSWQAFEEMMATSEEFYQSLGLPYQIMAIVSGALNNAAAKKYDLEAWFPFQREYKELVSCSNCTDYQARALEIRFGVKKTTDLKKTYVHALNATLCATERTLCCVLENYQREDGIEVPLPLRKYIPGAPEFLPYTKELPKDTTSQKPKGKSANKSARTDDATKKMEGLQV